jgi:hypothetical protein
MELILAVLGAGPIGFFTETRKQGLVIYLIAWAIVFPIQTGIVGIYDDFDILYFVFNALILCLGIGLNRYGSILGERRRTRLASAAASEGSAA